MKAVIYDKGNFPNVLSLKEIEKPIPGDNEVLVKIHAASINAGDYRSMKIGSIPKGKIFGSDIAGRVEAAGKNINRLAIGDEVIGDISAVSLGGFAEYVAVPETVLALKPANVSFEAAAAVPMAAVTALQALRDKGQIQRGQKVLICGAGGGVGTFSVQLAKYFGAEVTAVCGTGNLELVRYLGADFVVDYTQQDYTKSGKRYDLILAVHGYQPLSVYKRALTPKGTAVIVGGASFMKRKMQKKDLLSIEFKEKIIKASAWCKHNIDAYPSNWLVTVKDEKNPELTNLIFTRFGLYSLCISEGVPKFLPTLCQTDFITMSFAGCKLERPTTLGNGDDCCNFYITRK